MAITLYHDTSATADLVREIEARAAEHGLTLSRWQTNHGNHDCTVTYSLHSGPRAARSTLQENCIKEVWFRGLEGKTANCRAYRALERMMAALEAYGQ